MGYLLLLGQQFEYRTGIRKDSVYDPRLQNALIDIMQDDLHSEQHVLQYANHLHSELSKLAQWAKLSSSNQGAVFEIKSKINRSLWVSQDSNDPFQIKLTDLLDRKLCREFVTDAIKFLHLIVESANYLNNALHSPIEINGAPKSGEYFLGIANPLAV
jgi:hypothetical protein